MPFDFNSPPMMLNGIMFTLLFMAGPLVFIYFCMRSSKQRSFISPITCLQKHLGKLDHHDNEKFNRLRRLANRWNEVNRRTARKLEPVLNRFETQSEALIREFNYLNEIRENDSQRIDAQHRSLRLVETAIGQLAAILEKECIGTFYESKPQAV